MKSIFKTMSIIACSFMLSFSASAQESTVYGKKFEPKNPIQVSALAEKMGDKEKMEKVMLEGEISEVCQAAGCWMRLKGEGEETVFVKFGDHDFTIPLDLAGHKAYVYGTAIKKTVGVKEQKHLAEDGGASEEEIEKITEPKTELRVMATGVIIE